LERSGQHAMALVQRERDPEERDHPQVLEQVPPSVASPSQATCGLAAATRRRARCVTLPSRLQQPFPQEWQPGLSWAETPLVASGSVSAVATGMLTVAEAADAPEDDPVGVLDAAGPSGVVDLTEPRLGEDDARLAQRAGQFQLQSSLTAARCLGSLLPGSRQQSPLGRLPNAHAAGCTSPQHQAPPCELELPRRSPGDASPLAQAPPEQPVHQGPRRRPARCATLPARLHGLGPGEAVPSSACGGVGAMEEIGSLQQWSAMQVLREACPGEAMPSSACGTVSAMEVGSLQQWSAMQVLREACPGEAMPSSACGTVSAMEVGSLQQWSAMQVLRDACPGEAMPSSVCGGVGAMEISSLQQWSTTQVLRDACPGEPMPSSACGSVSAMEISSLHQQLGAMQVLRDALNRENLELQQHLRAAQEAARPGLAHATCVACLDAPASVVCLPCKHLALCGACSRWAAASGCPICRGEVSETLEVYTP